jgi:hypothetical protein
MHAARARTPMLIRVTVGGIASRLIVIDEGVEMRVLDAIQGHAPRNISEGYGEVTIKAKANASSKFPNMRA